MIKLQLLLCPILEPSEHSAQGEHEIVNEMRLWFEMDYSFYAHRDVIGMTGGWGGGGRGGTWPHDESLAWHQALPS